MRGIRASGNPECASLCDRQTAAAGYPRCERLAGALKLDGKVIATLTCPCTNVNAPDARCPFKTTAEVEQVEVTTGNGWVAPVTESKAACLAALTVGERARIGDIPDNERKPRP